MLVIIFDILRLID